MIYFIVYLTFIPWLFFFFATCKNTIRILNKNKITKKWIKKNIFNIFRFDNLFLIGIFVYFALFYPDANQIWLVELLLFSVINLYLYFNRLHDRDNKNSNMDIDDMNIYLILILIILIPIIFYISTSNYLITYYIMFGYNFFNYIIVYISMKISDNVKGLINHG